MNGIAVSGQQGGHPALNARILVELIEIGGQNLTDAENASALQRLAHEEQDRIIQHQGYVYNE